MGTIGQARTGKVEYDIDARERQVIGDGPRYAPLSEAEISDEAKELIDGIRTAFNVPDDASIPDVSLITLRHPGMFRGQMTMGIEVAGKGTIPPRERELAILRLATLVGAPFEWSEHVDIGQKFGVTPEEIERTTQGSSAEGWSEHERALLRAVEECLSDYCMSDSTWETLSKTYNEQQMIELPMVIGSYLMTALQQNSLRIQPRGGLRYR